MRLCRMVCFCAFFVRAFAPFKMRFCAFFPAKMACRKAQVCTYSCKKMCKKRFYAIPPLVIPPFACHRLPTLQKKIVNVFSHLP